ncbi:MAG: OmpA family protein [Rhodospirillales bacterium]|nr:OmpA family protein [Rhodospirillales bacterium]MDP6774244.1 OmpA family protein [Rhodospirillales bacterium]
MAQLVLILALAGCGGAFDYQGLREINPQRGDFTSALSREYQAFALFEAEEMDDLRDAARFRDKAIYAAQGEAVPPERVGDWRIPARYVGELEAARRSLVAAFDKGARAHLPAPAARAQARLDCWLEQREEDWQTAHIAACRHGFMTALFEIEGALGGPPASGSALSSTVLTPAALDGDQLGNPFKARGPRAFTVFFEFDSAALTPESEQAMDAIAASAKAGGPLHVIVDGHADRAGAAPYNVALSRRRANAVTRGLVARGLSHERLAVHAFGETRPRVLTPDGLRDPRNRRVEVVIGPGPAL